ncbi:3-isopropylmalate dehydratase small subunit [Aquabacter spiritensis]|uniref:3-isopropylmalate dehydratase small subunit n=1 Tax=Aquabacter spiritensis TaxID=933073 RepID=A0A4R3LVP4_9HYPH|nr:3-isopropylmalate dehydratase small subunit [Aquabacter spiritensis]TCT04634.1 3-isopropylmalate/(R)-2-methylmalate dehydratase small subunit [Aquabacter spiritensis]
MSLHIEGRIHRFGDEVNTDVILPGRYLTLRTPEELGRHCLEGLDPGFVDRVAPGDIIAAGRNFGCGSSREHAVIALKAVGVAAIVVESAARIFFRNAVNLGLPVLVCPDAARALAAGEPARIDLDRMAISQGARLWPVQPLGAEVRAILTAGGLVPRVRQALGA